uniref:GOLD domain-containing protein n=1 Tax=Mola mola TaxID=94237 RepID=A0A3Q3VSH8_MOLML
MVDLSAVAMRLYVLTALLLNVVDYSISSLHFHFGDGEWRCFTEEIPADTTLIGEVYRTRWDGDHGDEDPAANHDLGVFVEAKDPDDELALSRRYGSEGTFTFTARKAGRHQICLQPRSSQRPLSAGGPLTLQLVIHAGKATNNYAQIAADTQLTEMQLRVRQLARQVQRILRELHYQRLREKRFRDVSHSTNMWIYWWPVARSLYVVTFIIWITSSW